MNFRDLDNIDILAGYLKIDKKIIEKIIEESYSVIEDSDIRSFYSSGKDPKLVLKQIKILKKDKNFRIVYSPLSDTLKNLLKILNSKLNQIFTPLDCVHGYVKNKSIKTNATQHLQKKYIYVVDIESYFENINCKMITDYLTKLGFQKNISEMISGIVTYDDCLVQGFNTSPTLANIVFQELDSRFSKIENITYTRYADDLYFSSDSEIKIEDIIKENLEEFGFSINTNKTKYMYRGFPQYVTGLTVFDNIKPRISKKVKRKLRQEIYYINKYGYKGHILHKNKISYKIYISDKNIKSKIDDEIYRYSIKLNGWLLFINSIEPEFSNKYKSLLKNRHNFL